MQKLTLKKQHHKKCIYEHTRLAITQPQGIKYTKMNWYAIKINQSSVWYSQIVLYMTKLKENTIKKHRRSKIIWDAIANPFVIFKDSQISAAESGDGLIIRFLGGYCVNFYNPVWIFLFL